MTTTSTDWFSVDKEGLASILARRGAWFVVYELIQNAIDEDGVTTVSVTLEPVEGSRGKARLVVRDDAPDGFADLTHAYTLFAPSKKKGDAEKRGRFNLGEKLVLAICESAEIRSTTGGYRFDTTGRHRILTERSTGSEFYAIIRMTRADVEEAGRRVFQVIPPAGISLTYNGQRIEDRTPVHSFQAQLGTEAAGDDGLLFPTKRWTTVRLYDPAGDEKATIYEMGIPVVELGDRWHVDVAQKVPLNMDRDNVTPGWLRKLRTAVLNEMADRLTADDATSTWVKDAMGSKDADPDAVRTAVVKLYGEDAVVFDPSDMEANKLAMAEGRTVIPARAFDKATWANVRATGTFRPAGQVTPSNSSIMTSPEGKPPIPESEWTPGMVRVVEYARAFGKVLVGQQPTVSIHRAVAGPVRWSAAYSPGTLMLNLGVLGHRWFDAPDLEKIDALLIHEFGHHYSSDHLDRRYLDALCTLGARAKAHAGEVTF